ncbi:MAG: DUF2752 domain-containing protein [Acidobacteriaceae bacterium]|nr:DUF2752 domain-containing protein [Acidobacteriaceae bacterium]
MLTGNPSATDARYFRNVLRCAQLLAAGVLLSLVLIPARWVEQGPSLCLIKRVSGHDCLGCGMTRAASALLHGNVSAAIAHNRGSLVVVPLMIGFAAASLRRRA